MTIKLQTWTVKNQRWGDPSTIQVRVRVSFEDTFTPVLIILFLAFTGVGIFRTVRKHSKHHKGNI